VTYFRSSTLYKYTYLLTYLYAIAESAFYTEIVTKGSQLTSVLELPSSHFNMTIYHLPNYRIKFRLNLDGCHRII